MMLSSLLATQQPFRRVVAVAGRCAGASSPSRLFTTSTARLMTAIEPPSSNHKHTPFPDAKARIIYTETDEGRPNDCLASIPSTTVQLRGC